MESIKKEIGKHSQDNEYSGNYIVSKSFACSQKYSVWTNISASDNISVDQNHPCSTHIEDCLKGDWNPSSWCVLEPATQGCSKEIEEKEKDRNTWTPTWEWANGHILEGHFFQFG